MRHWLPCKWGSGFQHRNRELSGGSSSCSLCLETLQLESSRSHPAPAFDSSSSSSCTTASLPCFCSQHSPLLLWFTLIPCFLLWQPLNLNQVFTSAAMAHIPASADPPSILLSAALCTFLDTHELILTSAEFFQGSAHLLPSSTSDQGTPSPSSSWCLLQLRERECEGPPLFLPEALHLGRNSSKDNGFLPTSFASLPYEHPFALNGHQCHPSRF